MLFGVNGFGVTFVLMGALRGSAGPDVFVCDVVGVFCRDVDGKVGECGGDFVGPKERERKDGGLS